MAMETSFVTMSNEVTMHQEMMQANRLVWECATAKRLSCLLLTLGSKLKSLPFLLFAFCLYARSTSLLGCPVETAVQVVNLD